MLNIMYNNAILYFLYNILYNNEFCIFSFRIMNICILVSPLSCALGYQHQTYSFPSTM